MRTLLLLLFTFSAIHLSAQTLIEIEDESISVEEFKQQYEKGVNPNYSQESVDHFLRLYTSYRLKLADAYAQGIHEKPELLREIAIYEEQLIQNEINREMMDDLVQEVRSRLQEEVCASHILIDLKRSATPEDTLLAYQHAMRIRERILTGQETMESMAKRYSADVDTKYKSGDLGCFTSLHLKNYSLENQLYNMRPGQLSLPVRTSQGYHLLKLDDRRPSNGMVQAKQLFVRANALQTPEQNQLAEQFIFQAYNVILNGASFNEIENNQDIEISRDRIPFFTVGTYEKVMENAIFDLEKEEYSRPVKSSIGWHIFQLIDRKPLPDFDQIEGNIRDAIQEDERYFLSKLEFSERLKTKHNFKLHQENIDLFIQQAAPGIGIPNWQMGTIYNQSLPFFSIGNKDYPAMSFVNYVLREHDLENYQSFDYYYKNYESDQLLNYHREHLIETDPRVASLFEEFRSGLIIFDYLQDKVWAKEPTEEELIDYFKKTKDNYQFPDKTQLQVFSISDERFAQKLETQLDKRGLAGWKRLKGKNADQFQQSTRILSEVDQIRDKTVLNSKGDYLFLNDDGGSKLYVYDKVIEGEYPLFEEVKGEVLEDFSLTRDEKLIKDLKSKYPVSVNESLLRSLYK